jgi:hypothetical protein
VFERTYDPVTPMLTAAIMYWCLVNMMRIGFELLDRMLNQHLVADEQRRQEILAATRQSPLARWTSIFAPGTEQAR